MIRALFVLELHMGHATFAQNLRRFVGSTGKVDASWVHITYKDHFSRWNSVPLLTSNLRGTLIGRSQIRQALRETRPDIVYFNTQTPAALAGSRLVGRQPYLASTDMTPIQYDQMAAEYGHKPDSPGLISAWKHRVNSVVFQRAARLLPWSSWVARSMISDYGASKDLVEVFPPGVDLEVWKPAPRPSDKAVRILFVGGDFYRKGGKLLLDAFATLPPGLVELNVVTRSAVPEREGVEIHRNLRPNSPELIALYQSCDVFVLPSKAEAFGISAVEASAVGLPAIATPVGGLTDIVVDQSTGYLLGSDSPDKLAECLRSLASDPGLRRQMGQAARARAERCYDARKNAAHLENILVEILDR